MWVTKAVWFKKKLKKNNCVIRLIHVLRSNFLFSDKNMVSVQSFKPHRQQHDTRVINDVCFSKAECALVHRSWFLRKIHFMLMMSDFKKLVIMGNTVGNNIFYIQLTRFCLTQQNVCRKPQTARLALSRSHKTS